MDDFLFFLVTVGFPVTGVTIVLTSYIVNRYRERRFLIEKGRDFPKDYPVFPVSRIAILRTGIIFIGISLGMLAGIKLMDVIKNPVVSEDEGIAWGITIPLFTGLSLILSYFIKSEKKEKPE